MADVRVQPAVKIVDPTTDANEMSVDASGNAAVILASNTGVDIGDVDVLSVIPGVGATNLGKAVDAVAGGTDTGVGALYVRDDVLGGITPAAGDYTTGLVNANGAIWVIHDGLITTELPVAAALADDEANPTVPGVGGFMMGFDSGNTNWNRVEVDDAGHLQVDVLSGGGSPAAPTNPTIDIATSAAVAAGTEVDLDSAAIAEPENLTQVTISASVPFKARITLVENTVETVIAELFGRAGTPLVWQPPDRRYTTVSNTAGTDVFRVQMTNMDTSEAADLYASFFYQSN
jgi:hypothetical protein